MQKKKKKKKKLVCNLVKATNNTDKQDRFTYMAWHKNYASQALLFFRLHINAKKEERIRRSSVKAGKEKSELRSKSMMKSGSFKVQVIGIETLCKYFRLL